MADGAWFHLPHRAGDRSLAEQMLGLEGLDVRGCSVLDLGCAEGLIGIEMAKQGARLVHGVENNPRFVLMAREFAGPHPCVRIFEWDLNGGPPALCLPRYDVVLLLAILHKLTAPTDHLRRFAGMADRLVIRLPLGSHGQFLAKHGDADEVREYCDTVAVLGQCGMRLTDCRPGPRGELVHHWQR